MRLIDADALAKFIDYGHLNNPNDKCYSENDIREMIDMMPTQAPVIYCKDCMYQKKHKAIFYCDLFKEWEPLGEDNQFCSNARRRSNE